MDPRVPAVVVVTAAVLVAGGAAASAKGTAKSRTTKLTLGIETTSLAVVDVGSAGASPGDLVIEDDDITRGAGRSVRRSSRASPTPATCSTARRSAAGRSTCPRVNSRRRAERYPSMEPSRVRARSPAERAATTPSGAPTPSPARQPPAGSSRSGSPGSRGDRRAPWTRPTAHQARAKSLPLRADERSCGTVRSVSAGIRGQVVRGGDVEG